MFGILLFRGNASIIARVPRMSVPGSMRDACRVRASHSARIEGPVFEHTCVHTPLQDPGRRNWGAAAGAGRGGAVSAPGGGGANAQAARRRTCWWRRLSAEQKQVRVCAGVQSHVCMLTL